MGRGCLAEAELDLRARRTALEHGAVGVMFLSPAGR